jgi:endonuclease YncB( thermonuclease family)
MKNTKRLLTLLLVLCLAAGVFAGCGKDDAEPSATTAAPTTAPTAPDDTPAEEIIDYVSQLKLNMGSNTLKQEVTVHNYIDGDTTHFNVPRDIDPDGILKARYLCVNTPESTGKIEQWGKKASNFTKEKLKNAASIIIESNDTNWNADSTGDRYLVWVWYKPTADADYRCLNLELIQNGLSISCGTVAERYGDTASSAFQQAKRQKLNVFSKEKDPDFFYGDAYEVSLKHLRTNISLYENCKVAFEGIVTYNSNNSVYVESYDAETDMYYGISVYYGFETGAILNNLAIGNRVRVVGSVQYYEAGGTWQVSDVSYREFKPNDPGNTKPMDDQFHPAGNRVTDPAVFANGTVDVETYPSIDSDQGEVTNFKYAALAMNSTISMKDLYVRDVYTTASGNSQGAMTLTCTAGGVTITVRTVVLRDENGNLMTEADYIGKTIDVTGIVDYFSGEYQIKVFTPADINVHE